MACAKENQWIIHRRISSISKHRPAIRQRVAHRAMNLRNAAQRISVLHSSTFPMRFANLAALQHLAQICRRSQSAPHAVALCEFAHPRPRRFRATRRATSSQSHRRSRSCLRRQQSQRADGQHGLSAIDQRDRFFGLQRQRRDARALLPRLCSLESPAGFFPFKALHLRRSAPEPDAPVAPDRRWRPRCPATEPPDDPAVQHFAKCVDHNWPHAGMAFGKRVRAQQHHGACFRLW